MKVLILGLNYAPELVGCGRYTADLAQHFAANGHQVRVLCAPPYYPIWKVQAPFRAWAYQRSREHGVDVWRCPIWVPRQPRTWSRVFHLLSFALSSALGLLGSLRWRPQVVLLIAPTMACAPATILYARLSGARAWIHLQDLELRAASGLGWFQCGAGMSWGRRLQSWLLRKFDRISTISSSMSAVLAQAELQEPPRILPNWVDPTVETLASEPHRDAHARFTLLAAGTVNVKQNLDAVLNAARCLVEESRVQFIICGDGPEKARLQQSAADLPNIQWLPTQPEPEFRRLMVSVDAHLLTQKAGLADSVLPSKLGAMLASGRPVIATAAPGSDLASALQGRGLVVPPDDDDELVLAILRLCDDPPLGERLGRLGREFACQALARDSVLEQFSGILEAT